VSGLIPIAANVFWTVVNGVPKDGSKRALWQEATMRSCSDWFRERSTGRTGMSVGSMS
jgi:hypothetical protein